MTTSANSIREAKPLFSPNPVAHDLASAPDIIGSSKQNTIGRAAVGVRAPDFYEDELQEDGGFLGDFIALLFFKAFVVLSYIPHRAKAWCQLHRLCAWCRCSLGGNPFSKKITHGICRSCSDKMLSQAQAITQKR